jgi:hypothetical protein
MHDGVRWIIFAKDDVLVTAVSTASAPTATASHALAGLFGGYIFGQAVRGVLLVRFV